MEKFIRNLIGGLILCLAPACIKDKVLQGADLTVGERLPEFSVTLDDGRTVSTEDLLGNVSCIVFFHTECPDCQKTLPLVQELYDRYGVTGQISGNATNGKTDNDMSSEMAQNPVRFLCISREEGAEPIAGYWAANGYTLPYSPQEGREIYNLFATFAVPRIYISDRDGIIRSIFTDNPVPTLEELEAAILALL